MIAKIEKILYTTDLSENSPYVFRYALSLANLNNAKVDVIYVLPPAGFGSSVMVDVMEKQLVLEKMKKRVDEFVQAELKDDPLKEKRISSVKVVEGSPIVGILQAVEDLKPDILIMGTHSKGLIGHTFLGSVAQNVLQRVRIPVYIIPLPK